MREATRCAVERWWSRVLGVAPAELWSTTTVREHAATSPLARYGGWWVVRGGDGLHVSQPAGAAPPDPALLADPGRHSEASAWRALARERRLRVVGPAVHAYLDTAPVPAVTGPGSGAGSADADVRRCEPADLQRLREQVGPAAWGESGFRDVDPATDPCFALVRRGEVVAASNLTPFDGLPRDVGLLVAPACRGQGLGVRLGAHAAAYAVDHHGHARWRARVDNGASLAIALRLGFEPWCRQLALR